MEKITRENLFKHLLVYQLDLVGKKLIDTLDDDHWHFNFTITREKSEEFKKYALKLIRKTYKCNKGKGEDILITFLKELGLRIKN
tara:strand:+ start:18288 stop:18542 length:255 start_codon:yes stop_codon:yes gene_type:complete